MSGLAFVNGRWTAVDGGRFGGGCPGGRANSLADPFADR